VDVAEGSDNHVDSQMLGYNKSRVIPRLANLGLENVDKMQKLSPSLTLGLSSDLGSANPRIT